jgi:hypothetical protein
MVLAVTRTWLETRKPDTVHPCIDGRQLQRHAELHFQNTLRLFAPKRANPAVGVAGTGQQPRLECLLLLGCQ